MAQRVKYEGIPVKKDHPKKKTHGKFIRGPIPIEVTERLVREFPPSVFLTYLILIYVKGLRGGSNQIVPKYSHALEIGLSPRSFRRGLATLQTAGIITVVRGRGVKPHVKIL